MSCPDTPVDAESPGMWPAFDAVLSEIENRLSSEAVVGDPTAPWEGIADNATVQMSGAVLKALCEITATAEGAMEWRPDSILLHSGVRAPVPLRFHTCTPLSAPEIESMQ
jgi:hypothetical protein